jgi:mannose-6-phosphate isomerase-like protein (cupin superfamily)
MTAVIRPGAGQRLSLPGRTSVELISAAEGGYGVTVRRVTIPPETDQAPARGPHRHEGCEEVIAILAGTGAFETAGSVVPVGPGDVVVVSPGEPHRTRNTGTDDLVSLCFFAVPDLAAVTTELPPTPGSSRTPGISPARS